MAGTSALWPLHVAIAAAVIADGALAALLGGDKVYSLVAPRGVVLTYLVLGQSAALELPTFTRAGESGAILVHLWVVGEDQAALLQLYGEMRRVLHNVRLALTGTTQLQCTGQLSLVTTSADPSGEFVHGVARYAFQTL
jgi:uncharacterized protein DUF3168